VTLATRLFAGVLLAVLLLGAGVHAVAAVDSGVDSASASDTIQTESTADGSATDDAATTDGFTATELLTLNFSVKRLLVSLGFIGALVARRQGRAA
jgi:hypothetical protein